MINLLPINIVLRLFQAVFFFSFGIFLTACSNNQFFNKLSWHDAPGVKKLWQVQIGEGSGKYYKQLVPAFTEQAVYVVNADGVVQALHRSNGQQIWKVDVDVSTGGGVFAGYGLVLFGSSDGELIALSQADGSEKWRTELSSEILSSPQFNGEVVLVQTSDGSLYALDASSGAQKWVYKTIVPLLSLRGTSTPLIRDERVYAGFANGKFVSIPLGSGIPEWEVSVALPEGRSELDRIVDIDGRYVIEGDKAYVGTYQGNVAAISLSSGRIIWKKAISTHVGLESHLSNLYVTSSEGSIVALDQANGVEVWRQDSLSGRKPTVPVKMGAYLVVADSEGNLFWLSQIDGRVFYQYRVDGRTDRENPHVKNKARYQSIVRESGNGIRVPVTVNGNNIYLLNNHGVLSALHFAEK